MQRKINQSDYRVLDKEFHHLEKSGYLDPNQADQLLALYEPRKKISFVQTLLAIGSVLIGIGILSFIAGNWQVISTTVKFLILFFALVGFYVVGYKIASAYPRTSRSLYYIGVFIYGAGIFLIGQMFNLGEGIYADLLLWGIGILPLAYYLTDKYIAAGAAVLFGIYAFTIFDTADSFPYWLILLIPLLFWMNETKLERSKGLFIANVMLALVFILNLSFYFEFKIWITSLLFFAIGLALRFYPQKPYQSQSIWVGSIVYGIAGIYLTLPDMWAWSTSSSSGNIGAIVSTVLFIILLIFLLKVGDLAAILITCILIFRFYVDLSYDFMPKSLFFIIGGCLLIGFGFWFEKSRREAVDSHEEKTT